MMSESLSLLGFAGFRVVISVLRRPPAVNTYNERDSNSLMVFSGCDALLKPSFDTLKLGLHFT
jgi:hypothetical protein